MTVTSSTDFFRTKRFVCLLAVWLLAVACPALADTPGLTATTTAPPKASLANRESLPAVFRKIEPASIADLKDMERQILALVPRVSPAVVAVEVGDTSGSGVIISPDGFVLTAGHVCGAPNRNVVFTFPNGRKAYGRTVGVNRYDDTGLMRITNSGPWPSVELGDLRQARLGDWTLALGHPGGFDLKRSLVVRLGRIISLYDDLMQTDCTISPGDSGGPLFDMQGRVIGIHTAISDSLTENYHVPVTMFYNDWLQLATGQVVSRRGRITKPDPPMPYIGASVKDDAEGCRLDAIEANSPAFAAGLKPGDLVLEIEGRTVKLSATFWRWMDESGSGATLNLRIKRGHESLTLPLKLAPPKPSK